ncbi:hypothetical protein AGOR_G00034710 [Albula goreensis]|uniref:Uncharacterized protein n=1 Tax=Albula goreensis TaxID=1534307 RepID=A0A8T3E499_9TELE|nr:hypothetical protein AGOR_G00034710 [Albula goreensis]
MAEITNIKPTYDVSPVLAGFLGAGVLVVSVTVAVFLWTCCQRRYRQLTGSYKLHGSHSGHCDPATDPPYKFIHMLKGISIYPETLSNSKKIVRVARRQGGRGERDREWGRAGGGRGGGGVLLVDAAENGLLGSQPHLQMNHLVPSGGGGGSKLERELPIRADYCCLDSSSSASSSETNSAAPSKMASPFTPAEEPNLGALTLAVDYNFPKKALVVTILEARGLPAVDEESGSSDPT